MLGGGVDLRYIQEILGHKSSKTTEIYPVRNICYSYLCAKILDRYFYKLSGFSNGVYTHVSNRDLRKITSPLDLILKGGKHELGKCQFHL